MVGLATVLLIQLSTFSSCRCNIAPLTWLCFRCRFKCDLCGWKERYVVSLKIDLAFGSHDQEKKMRKSFWLIDLLHHGALAAAIKLINMRKVMSAKEESLLVTLSGKHYKLARWIL